MSINPITGVSAAVTAGNHRFSTTSGSMSARFNQQQTNAAGSPDRPSTVSTGTVRNKFPSPYHVTTYQLAHQNGPKHHFVTTHWSQRQPQQPASPPSAGQNQVPSLAASQAASDAQFTTSYPPSQRSALAGATTAARVAASSADTKHSTAAAAPAAATASGAAAAAASTGAPVLVGGTGLMKGTSGVYASYDGGESGSAPPPQKFKSAGKFTGTKKVYRAPASAVAESARRLASEEEEYRQRGLKFGSSIQNIAFHQPHVEMKLPARFSSPDFFERPLRNQHAAYRTTSNQIGHRPPNATELNKVYATRPISFSGSFTGGPYRSGGLNTGIAKPRVDTRESALNLG